MEHILSLSYGKDSLACLGAIEQLGWPLDRIVHAEVWATDTIPADLPPMVEFKAKADAIIKERWGIEVEHVCATTIYKNRQGINTYEKGFYYEMPDTSKFGGTIKGFPMQRGPWCNKLKTEAIKEAEKKTAESMFYQVRKKGNRAGQIHGFPMNGSGLCEYQKPLKVAPIKLNQKENISYLGIAADEPNRFHDLNEKKKSPLIEIGWTEADCRKWCEDNDLLSPIYQNSCRGGCWFCHNQGVDQLRQLRHNYPELWEILMKWDNDSPVSFKAGYTDKDGVVHQGHTVHDFDKRFQLEDQHLIDPLEKNFRWAMIEGDLQKSLF